MKDLSAVIESAHEFGLCVIRNRAFLIFAEIADGIINGRIVSALWHGLLSIPEIRH